MVATRRLAAIMFTDMVGFTSAAQTDEAVALKSLREQEDLLRPIFVAHEGREVKSTGDGFMVEFDSALRAVQCAIEVSQRIHERNSHRGVVPIQLRIGIHLGDVEEHGTDLFGDAVNIASRIQPLAPPGGVCISAQVFDQVRNKLPNRFDKLGSTPLKNVLIPMDVYRIALPWDVSETGRVGSNRARLAVLPLSNISPDPKDEYFADGLTEELISALSKLREIRVIARTSISQYKSPTKSVSQIGAELNVASILEGSVRKAGNRLRITLQLIDTDTEEHLWASTYDRELDDVFAVQIDIAKQVADALKVEVRGAEEARLSSAPSVRTDSYLAYLKGRTFFQERSEAALQKAKEQFELAISLDSRNAAAFSGLSDVTRVIGNIDRNAPLADWDDASRRLAVRAVELDANLAEAHTSLGFSCWSDYDYAQAEKEFQLAISLSPSYSAAHHRYSQLLSDQVRYDEALAQVSLAEEADPRSSIILATRAFFLTFLGRLEEAHAEIEKLGVVEGRQRLYHSVLAEYCVAISDFPRALREFELLAELRPGHPENAVAYGMCYALMGETERARGYLKELEGLDPRRRPDSGIASIYAYLGELDECFLWLERGAFENYDMDVALWRMNPLFETVRKDPRFEKLLRKMNLT